MLLLAFAMVLHQDSCQAVNSIWIYASDLAKVEPAFRSLPPETKITAAPIPGQVRTLQSQEIMRLAAAYKVPLRSAEEACFTFRTVALSSDLMRESMQEALAERHPEIRIVGQCAMPVPEGKPVFPLSGLSGYGTTTAIWRGYIEYGKARRFYTWARVFITVHEKRVVAKGSIKAGDRIDSNQLEIENYDGPLTREPALADISAITGKIARRDISVGSALTDSMLDTAPEVSRGELISVIAVSGAATIKSQGFAEQSGKVGDLISIRNPRSGKVYRGRVQHGGIALVVSGGFFGIVPGGDKS